MAIRIVTGVDLINDIKKYDVILVGTTILNKLGNGFQYKVGLNFPEVFEASKTRTKYGDESKLGRIEIVETTPVFVLCYITKGRYNPIVAPDNLDYNALINCLRSVKHKYTNKKIACPILGLSKFEGGGDKNKILDIFSSVFFDDDVTLYDYEQVPISIEKQIDWNEIKKHVGLDDYTDMKKNYFWKWAFGIYTPMPENKSLDEIRLITKKVKESKKNLASFK